MSALWMLNPNLSAKDIEELWKHKMELYMESQERIHKETLAAIDRAEDPQLKMAIAERAVVMAVQSFASALF